MQLAQLLKTFNLTPAQLQAVLSKHIVVPNLRLMREVPATWQAILTQELGAPVADAVPFAAQPDSSVEAVAGDAQLVNLVDEPPQMVQVGAEGVASATGGNMSSPPDLEELAKPERMSAPADEPVVPPKQAKSATAKKTGPPRSKRPDISQLAFGRITNVIAERGFGFLRKEANQGEIFWNIKQLAGVLPAVNDWVIFAVQPSQRQAGKLEVSWGRPLASDLPLLRQLLAPATEEFVLRLWESQAQADVQAVLVDELAGRLPPSVDDTTLARASLLVRAIHAKLPERAAALAAGAVGTAASAVAWQVWVRHCSPLVDFPAAAERLLALLRPQEAVLADWWPRVAESGIVGLYQSFIRHQPSAGIPTAWQQLKAALGQEQAGVYQAMLQLWLEGLPDIATLADYQRYQQAVASTWGNAAELAQALRQRLSPPARLELWLATPGAIDFQREEALRQFGALPNLAQLRIADALTDVDFRAVTGLLTADSPAALRERAQRLWCSELQVLFAAFAVDIESDQTTIAQLAWGWPGAWHNAVGADEVAAKLAALADHTAGTSAYLAIGHNLRDFDAPLLAADGVPLAAECLWDTLLVEMALQPALTTYALNTKHEAAADAALTWRIFENQVQRLVLADAAEWEQLQPLFTPAVGRQLTELRTAVSGAAWLPSGAELQAQVLGWLRPQPAPAALLTAVQAALAADLPPTRLLLAAPAEWGALCRLPSLRFYGGAEADPEYQELAETALQQHLAQHPVAAVWVSRFMAHCRQTGVVPTVAAMPPAMRARLLQVLNPADCLAASALPDWQQPQCCCLGPAQLLAEHARLQRADQAVVLVLESELLTLSHKQLLRDELTINDLLASAGSRTEWLKFSGGQSFVALTRSQAAELRAAPPAGYEHFWLEKRRYGSFRVWGSFGWEKLLGRLPNLAVRQVRSHDRAFPKGQLRGLAVEATRLQQRLGVTPFHPESIYRARYWLLQAELVESVARRQRAAPPVLLLTRPEEQAAVAQYFRQRGYYVPAQQAPLARQLELLHDSPRERRLLVAAEAQGSVLLQANYRGPVELLLDGFALGENYFLAQGTALFEEARLASGGRDAATTSPPAQTEPTDDELTGANAPEADDPETAPPVGAAPREFLARDPQFLLHLQRPLVRRWQALALDNHPDNRLWLLDPRLPDTPGLAVAWELQAELLDAPWATEETYQQAAAQAEEHFGGGQPASEINFDLEEAKDLLELAFLQLWEDGKLVQHRWRPEQAPYLDKILPAPANLSLLVSLPTGGGKSLLFQAPALYRSAYTNRLSLVVTPLKALMEDQVTGLWERGFYSSVDYLNQDKQDEVQQIYSRLAGGELMLLFITPERFRSRGFARALAQRLAADGGLEYAVFDEAHCISQWGHEFRPDYLHAARTVQGHRAVSPHKFPVLLFSATVTEKIYEGFTTLFG